MPSVMKVKALYRGDQTGKEVALPAVLTENGLVLSHLRYLSSRPGMSASWRERAVFSVMLLIKFINANKFCYSKATELLRAFSRALVDGTIDPYTLSDPSGLFWSPRKLEDARALLSLITSYTDWLVVQPGYDGQRINPFRKANSAEQRLNWCAYYHKKNNVFLNHLICNEVIRRELSFVREIRVPNSPLFGRSEVKRFPESEIKSLLDIGFVKSGARCYTPESERMDYRSQAITLLLHYGGVRKSEALQLYLSDICVDSKRVEAIVRVYHPSVGEPPDNQYRTRKDFLAKRYQLKPRNEYLKSESLHLGWKAPLLSDRRGFFLVQFFPSSKAADFLFAWANYLKFQRVDPPEGFEHPYAFTNSKGHPETIKNYQRLHKAAVERLGLEHRKCFGTTEHGHRHSYGYRLAEHGLTQVQIQKSMHHKSPESCLVYIQPSDDELREIMKGAE